MSGPGVVPWVVGVSRGEILVALGRFEDAVQVTRRMLGRRESSYHLGWYVACLVHGAEVYLRAGEVAAASACLREASCSRTSGRTGRSTGRGPGRCSRSSRTARRRRGPTRSPRGRPPLRLGEPERARDLALRALRAGGPPIFAARAHALLATCSALDEETDDDAEHLRWTEGAGGPGQGWLDVHRGWCRALRGEPAQAIELTPDCPLDLALRACAAELLAGPPRWARSARA